MPPVVLSIAGFDPSSGAGLTADLKTISAHGCFGVGCVTALTVQNTQEVSWVEPVTAGLVTQTLQALASDMEISAVRVGMLGSSEVAKAVAGFLKFRVGVAVVLDPVWQSSSGTALLELEGMEVLVKELIPLAEVITPNLDEATALAGFPVRTLEDMGKAAEAIHRLGAKHVLITGGHLEENSDLLRTKGGEVHIIKGNRIESRATHGTGCALATAIACNLANGMNILEAVKAAKEYVRRAVEAAYPVGKGRGPIHHLFKLDRKN